MNNWKQWLTLGNLKHNSIKNRSYERTRLMDVYRPIIGYVDRYIDLTGEEVDIFTSLLKHKRLTLLPDHHSKSIRGGPPAGHLPQQQNIGRTLPGVSPTVSRPGKTGAPIHGRFLSGLQSRISEQDPQEMGETR